MTVIFKDVFYNGYDPGNYTEVGTVVGYSKYDAVMENVVDFFVEQGSYTAADKEKLFSGSFIDGQFIEALAKEKGLSMN